MLVRLQSNPVSGLEIVPPIETILPDRICVTPNITRSLWQNIMFLIHEVMIDPDFALEEKDAGSTRLLFTGFVDRLKEPLWDSLEQDLSGSPQSYSRFLRHLGSRKTLRGPERSDGQAPVQEVEKAGRRAMHSDRLEFRCGCE